MSGWQNQMSLRSPFSEWLVMLSSGLGHTRDKSGRELEKIWEDTYLYFTSLFIFKKVCTAASSQNSVFVQGSQVCSRGNVISNTKRMNPRGNGFEGREKTWHLTEKILSWTWSHGKLGVKSSSVGPWNAGGERTLRNCSRAPYGCCSCLVAKLCPTLCHLMDCILPGSSVHGVS